MISGAGSGSRGPLMASGKTGGAFWLSIPGRWEGLPGPLMVKGSRCRGNVARVPAWGPLRMSARAASCPAWAGCLARWARWAGRGPWWGCGYGRDVGGGCVGILAGPGVLWPDGAGGRGASLVGPGPLWADQKPGGAVDAGPVAGSDCDQKPKSPFCNDSKLPGRNVSGGPEKSCTPYTRVKIKLPFCRVAKVHGSGPISCNQARLSPWCCTPYTCAYQATPPP